MRCVQAVDSDTDDACASTDELRPGEHSPVRPRDKLKRAFTPPRPIASLASTSSFWELLHRRSGHAVPAHLARRAGARPVLGVRRRRPAAPALPLSDPPTPPSGRAVSPIAAGKSIAPGLKPAPELGTGQAEPRSAVSPALQIAGAGNAAMLLAPAFIQHVVDSGAAHQCSCTVLASASTSGVQAQPRAQLLPATAAVCLPPSAASSLRPHQVDGIRRMACCLAGQHNPGSHGALLGDSMGLGKSCQACHVIWALRCASTQRWLAPGPCTGVIIVCPTSLVSNWCKELSMWLSAVASHEPRQPCHAAGPRLAAAAVYPATAGGAQLQAAYQTAALQVHACGPGAHAVQAFLAGVDHAERTHAAPLPILVTSYETVRSQLRLFRAAQPGGMPVKPWLLVADEAHRLRNGQAQVTQAIRALNPQWRLLLTGTPLQNDLQELQVLLDLVSPGVVGTAAEFAATFSRPILQAREPWASAAQQRAGKQAEDQLQDLMRMLSLRRVAADLRRHLPPKVVQIVCVAPAPSQVALHTAASEYAKRATDSEGVAALQAVNALRRLLVSPLLLFDRHALDGRGSARAGSSIGEPANPVKAGSCSALLRMATTHAEWWVGHSADGQPTDIVSAAACAADAVRLSGKLQWLARFLAYIHAHTTDKVVLVSLFTDVLALVRSMCEWMGWQSAQLDGSTPAAQRAALARQFADPARRPGSPTILLLSSKAGGCGLNLIGANRLVLLEPSFNPADDAQAAARIWRDGQIKWAYVYRLVVSGSAEETILQRQLRREGLQARVVGEDEDVNAQLTADDTAALLLPEFGRRSALHHSLRCLRCAATALHSAALAGERGAQGQAPRPAPSSDASPATSARQRKAASAALREALRNARNRQREVPVGHHRRQQGEPGDTEVALWAHSAGTEGVDDRAAVAAGAHGLTKFTFHLYVNAPKPGADGAAPRGINANMLTAAELEQVQAAAAAQRKGLGVRRRRPDASLSIHADEPKGAALAGVLI